MSDEPRWRRSLLRLVLALGVGVLLYAIFTPRHATVRRAALRIVCKNNLKQIGLALTTYRSREHLFPPQLWIDAAGRPMHSWRLLITPYHDGAGSVAERYDLTRPWNAQSNLVAAKAPSDDWQCRADEQARIGETSYVAVVGPGFLFDGTNTVTPETVTDGLRNTIAVVEIADAHIPWNEPRDITWDEFARRYDARTLSHHEGSFNALFADGATRFIPYGLERKLMRAVFTIAGGETIPSPAALIEISQQAQEPGSQTPATEEAQAPDENRP